jgi:hypothetical protein
MHPVLMISDCDGSFVGSELSAATVWVEAAVE